MALSNENILSAVRAQLAIDLNCSSDDFDRDGFVMQKAVKEFIEKYRIQTDVQTRYVDLVSEVGELGKEIIKSTNYGKNSFTLNNPVADEIGDCLFSLLALCCELNTDAKSALCDALSKYECRFTEKGEIGSDI